MGDPAPEEISKKAAKKAEKAKQKSELKAERSAKNSSSHSTIVEGNSSTNLVNPSFPYCTLLVL